MARQSSPSGGRSSSSHGYWVTSPVAADQRNCPDSSQPQRTPSFPVKTIWPLDHTGGPDGYDLARSLERASTNTSGATIFGYHVADPTSYGVVEFAPDGRVLSLEEKPAQPKSNYAIPGIYFYDEDVVALSRSLKPSKRGELEITDLNRLYLERGDLRVEILGRGIAWLDTGTHDSLVEAGQFVSVIENRQGLKIACLEEIGFRRGWLTRDGLEASVAKLGKSSYGAYLKKILTE